MTLDTYERITVERRDPGILWLTINRPERLNAADELLHHELSRIWVDVSEDPTTRVAVVTGAGKAFCAGGDLDMIQEQIKNYQMITRVMKDANDLVYNMVNCDKPIVSAINGVAVGAGLTVALMADISIMAEEAQVTDGHIRLGVVAGDHAAMAWPLLCGLAKARYYLLTADFIDGREAERIGLVSRCVPGENLLDDAMAVAEKLATGPQLAVRLTKRALNNWIRTAGPTFEASLAMEMLTFFGDDVEEGAQALRERRPPLFDPMSDSRSPGT